VPRKWTIVTTMSETLTAISTSTHMFIWHTLLLQVFVDSESSQACYGTSQRPSWFFQSFHHGIIESANIVFATDKRRFKKRCHQCILQATIAICVRLKEAPCPQCGVLEALARQRRLEEGCAAYQIVHHQARETFLMLLGQHLYHSEQMRHYCKIFIVCKIARLDQCVQQAFL
jgi:hypothetical protein